MLSAVFRYPDGGERRANSGQLGATPGSTAQLACRAAKLGQTHFPRMRNPRLSMQTFPTLRADMPIGPLRGFWQENGTARRTRAGQTDQAGQAVRTAQ
ncbi:hypothetical protein GCM10010329_54300 [Streptomyces spiroverticillatus]|uniref:Uncharacterized protein n=1 Tax=Streptomyces finlayi TaxID=67296 RepID=A0A919CD88_9ACTN|nr:hypothetical protein GCM10010329_54300 [Streptomyces spiroverticillatus]GHD06086.1 hypothetical protein GCM10010334_57500 [Streptomyces finlayi]